MSKALVAIDVEIVRQILDRLSRLERRLAQLGEVAEESDRELGAALDVMQCHLAALELEFEERGERPPHLN